MKLSIIWSRLKLNWGLLQIIHRSDESIPNRFQIVSLISFINRNKIVFYRYLRQIIQLLISFMKTIFVYQLF